MSRLSRETEALLERGRAGKPLTAGHKARLKTEILAKATGAATITTTASAAGSMSLGAKIGGAFVMLAAMGGAGAAIEARVSHPPPTSSTTLASSSGVDHATPLPGPSFTRLPITTSSAVALQTPASTAVPPSTVTYPEMQLWPPKASAPEAHPASTATPISRGASSSIAAPVPSRSIVAALSSPVPTQCALPTSSPTASLARDVRLLRDADLAIKGGDPERALDLLDEHAAAFPRSDLEPERSAERVFALCRAGRLDESRNAASAFLSAHPTGPLAARVKRACRGGTL